MSTRLMDHCLRGSCILAGFVLLTAGDCGPGPTPPDPAVVLKADCGNGGNAYGPEVVGRPVTFNGSASTTPNPPLNYSWSFGDATTGTGITPTHTFRRCNYQCSGPQCSMACLNSGQLHDLGCCPTLCARSIPCAEQVFPVTLTVRDAAGGSAQCATSFRGSNMY